MIRLANLSSIIRLEDKVKVRLDPWGWAQTFPSQASALDTGATVVGFSEIIYGRTANDGMRPGVHANTCYLFVKLDTSGVVGCVAASDVSLKDGVEHERRSKEFYARTQEEFDEPDNTRFLRDLQETHFYEDDIVGIVNCDQRINGVVGPITRVLYDPQERPWSNMGYLVKHEKKNPFGIAVPEDNLELEERGLVWRYYHNLPLLFSSIEHEASFYDRIGRTRQVRNPRNNGFQWNSYEEALDALQKGIGDVIFFKPGPLTQTPRLEVYRYLEREVGDRIRKATILGNKAISN